MDSKGKMTSDLKSVQSLVLLAIFAALITITTYAFKIPIAATKGYFNLGDALIFISAALFGPVFGMIAGGVGSALADMLGGYAQYAPWTLVIKGAEGWIAGFLIYLFKVKHRSFKSILIMGISFVAAAAWMVAGYFGAEYIIWGFDLAPPMLELPFNIAQGGISAIIAIILVPLLQLALPKEGKTYHQQ